MYIKDYVISVILSLILALLLSLLFGYKLFVIFLLGSFLLIIKLKKYIIQYDIKQKAKRDSLYEQELVNKPNINVNVVLNDKTNKK